LSIINLELQGLDALVHGRSMKGVIDAPMRSPDGKHKLLSLMGFNERIADLEEELAHVMEAKTQMSVEYESEFKALQMSIDSLKESHQETMTATQTTHDQAIQRLEEQIAAINFDREYDKINACTPLEATINSLREQLRILEVEKQYVEKKLADNNEQLRLEYDERESKQLEKSRKMNLAVVDTLKKQYEMEITKLRAALSEKAVGNGVVDKTEDIAQSENLSELELASVRAERDEWKVKATDLQATVDTMIREKNASVIQIVDSRKCYDIEPHGSEEANDTSMSFQQDGPDEHPYLADNVVIDAIDPIENADPNDITADSEINSDSSTLGALVSFGAIVLEKPDVSASANASKIEALELQLKQMSEADDQLRSENSKLQLQIDILETQLRSLRTSDKAATENVSSPAPSAQHKVSPGLDDLQLRLAQAEADCVGYRGQNDLLSSDNATLVSSISELEQDISGLRRDFSKLEDQRIALEIENKRLQSELENAQAQAQVQPPIAPAQEASQKSPKTEDASDVSKPGSPRFSAVLRQLQEQNLDLAAQVSEANNQLTVVAQERDGFVAKCNDLSSQLQDAQDKVTLLANQLQEQSTAASSDQARESESIRQNQLAQKRLEEDLSSSKADHEATVSQLTHEISDLLHKVALAQAEASDWSSRHAAVTCESSSTIEQLKAEIASLKKEHEDTCERIREDARQRVSSSDKTGEVFRSEIDRLTSQQNEYKVQIQELTQSKSAIQKEKEELAQINERMQSRVDDVDQLLDEKDVQAHQRIEELEDEIQELHTRVDDLTSEKTKLYEIIVDLQDNVRQLEQLHEEIREEPSQSAETATVNDSESKADEANAAIYLQLQSDNNSMLVSNVRLQEEISSLQALIESNRAQFTAEVSAANAIKNKLQEDLVESNRRSIKLEQLLQDLNAQRTASQVAQPQQPAQPLPVGNEDKREELMRLQQAVDEAEVERDTEKQKVEVARKTILSLQQLRNEQQEEILSLQRDMGMVENEREAEKQRFEMECTRLRELQKEQKLQISQFQRTVQEVCNEREQLDAELQVLQEQVEQFTQENDTLQHSVTALTFEKECVEQEKQQIKKEMVAVEKELAAEKNKGIDAVCQLQLLDEKVQSLNAENRRLSEEAAQQKIQSAKDSMKQANLDVTIKDLQEKLGREQALYKSLEAELQTARAEISSLTSSISTMRNESSSQTSASEELLRREIAELTQELSSLRQDSQQRTDAFSQQRDELKKAHDSSIGDLIAKHESEMSQFKSEIDSLSSELISVRKEKDSLLSELTALKKSSPAMLAQQEQSTEEPQKTADIREQAGNNELVLALETQVSHLEEKVQTLSNEKDEWTALKTELLASTKYQGNAIKELTEQKQSLLATISELRATAGTAVADIKPAPQATEIDKSVLEALEKQVHSLELDQQRHKECLQFAAEDAWMKVIAQQDTANEFFAALDEQKSEYELLIREMEEDSAANAERGNLELDRQRRRIAELEDKVLTVQVEERNRFEDLMSVQLEQLKLEILESNQRSTSELVRQQEIQLELQDCVTIQTECLLMASEDLFGRFRTNVELHDQLLLMQQTLDNNEQKSHTGEEAELHAVIQHLRDECKHYKQQAADLEAAYEETLQSLDETEKALEEERARHSGDSDGHENSQVDDTPVKPFISLHNTGHSNGVASEHPVKPAASTSDIADTPDKEFSHSMQSVDGHLASKLLAIRAASQAPQPSSLAVLSERLLDHDDGALDGSMHMLANTEEDNDQLLSAAISSVQSMLHSNLNMLKNESHHDDDEILSASSHSIGNNNTGVVEAGPGATSTNNGAEVAALQKELETVVDQKISLQQEKDALLEEKSKLMEDIVNPRMELENKDEEMSSLRDRVESQKEQIGAMKEMINTQSLQMEALEAAARAATQRAAGTSATPPKKGTFW
jgi:chromosome segregation ATPase